jgi:hypothetical protein
MEPARASRPSAALLVLLLTGCAAEPRGQDRPVREGPDVADLDAATRELLAKVRSAGGWPKSVQLTGTPPRPLARVEVRNETSAHLDNRAWSGRVRQLLTEDGSLAVAADDDAAGAEGAAPKEHDGALRLLCSIHEDRQATEETVTSDYLVSLTLFEPDGARVLFQADRRSRQVRGR